MYTSFFGLNEKPFTITPDPRYLFMSERHGEGLAHLLYGVTESGGFIQLTGEVGTGKTTLVRTLLGQIPSEVDIALILNPQLTAVEFLTAICEELGIELPTDRSSAKALVDALNRHLLDAHARGRRTILLIDEAQNLADDVLEQLRLLTNLETTRQKLLQIILIAQPELREKLSQNHLRQLAQRVTGRYHLESLSREEADQYIEHRLRVAGALTEIFDGPAKREVYRLSAGIPRVINVICDRALLGAYGQESRRVNKAIVRRAALEVSGQQPPSTLMKIALPVVAMLGLAAIGAAIWAVIDKAAKSPLEATAMPVASVPATIAPDVALAMEEAPAPPPAEGGSLKDLLAQRDGAAASGFGVATLLSLWGIEYDAAGGSACTQVEQQGLRCYFQRGSWTGIRQLDRPVVLTLTDKQGNTYQPALVSLDLNVAELAFAGERNKFPLSEVEEFWFGQFMLIWDPPGDAPVVISRGMQDDSVRWLRQSLAALDESYTPDRPDSNIFDDELQQQLVAFQRRHRLEIDGLAGQKTQIIINTLLSPENSPRLMVPQ